MNKKLFSIMLLIILTGVSSQISRSASVSAPAIEWQKDYGHPGPYDDTNVESASNLIQTKDGGYVFMALAWSYQFTFNPSTVFKADSSGRLQWNKTIEFLAASTIIQTNDEGYEIAGHWSTYGTTYERTPTLIKMDSKGNIQWSANFSSVPDLGIDSSKFQIEVGVGYRKDGNIQTSDGGFVYWKGGTITKTDSDNKTQWIKIVTYPTYDAYPTYTRPLSLFSVIETSDGALAALGVGYNDISLSRSGRIYLIKTEAFLPSPPQTPLPTPILTPITPPTPTPLPAPNVEAIAIASLIIGMVAGAGLTLFLKKRKH